LTVAWASPALSRNIKYVNLGLQGFYDNEKSVYFPACVQYRDTLVMIKEAIDENLHNLTGVLTSKTALLNQFKETRSKCTDFCAKNARSKHYTVKITDLESAKKQKESSGRPLTTKDGDKISRVDDP